MERDFEGLRGRGSQDAVRGVDRVPGARSFVHRFARLEVEGLCLLVRVTECGVFVVQEVLRGDGFVPQDAHRDPSVRKHEFAAW